ncbi:hypothetical protein G9A89_022016 [Geosiphon pyriformis]|nr:hypothetical protein G9A89_022016 [Geosiphon pyriformis]
MTNPYQRFQLISPIFSIGIFKNPSIRDKIAGINDILIIKNCCWRSFESLSSNKAITLYKEPNNKINIINFNQNSIIGSIVNSSIDSKINLVNTQYEGEKSTNLSGTLLNQIEVKKKSFIKNRISVAPMYKVTTQHFLQLCRIISSNISLYTEMIPCNTILKHNESKTLSRVIGKPLPDTVVQLGGADPSQLGEAVKILEREGWREFNLNVGCPSTDVQCGSFGAILMKTPDQVARIVTAMTEAQETPMRFPVTVKCRIGVDQMESYEFLHQFISKVSQTGVVTHFILHARKCLLKGLNPTKNLSVPPLNYNRVYEIARNFPNLNFTINGGIDSIEKLKEQLRRVDGVMIGRKDYLESYITHIPKAWPLSLGNILNPLYPIIPGKKGKFFRTHLQETTRELKRRKPQIAGHLTEENDLDDPLVSRSKLAATIRKLIQKSLTEASRACKSKIG